jgi:hypothetical protein
MSQCQDISRLVASARESKLRAAALHGQKNSFHLHRGAAEVDNSPLPSQRCLLFHTFTPQQLLSPPFLALYPANEGTLLHPTSSLNPA